MMNTHYTAMTVWVGYLLVICDIPYSEKGIYPYLIRTSRKSWLLGQILYLFLVTIFYFFYVGLVDKCFCQNAECTMEMWNKELFFFYVFANKA